MKKGQVTAFVVLGVIIVILGAVFFLAQPSGVDERTIEESVAITSDGIAVSQFIKGCMDTTAKSGVLLAGLQGGYTDVPPNYFPSAYSDIPYYYDRGQQSVVELNDVESQIERFMNSNVKACINNFEDFTEKGVSVSAVNSPLTDVTINPLTGMSVALNYEVTVGSGEMQESLTKFAVVYDYRLGLVRDTAQKIVDEVAENPKLVPLSYLTELNEQTGLQIDSFSYGDDKVVYIIKDLGTIVEGDTPLLFIFAVKTDITNSPPLVVIDESQLTGSVGEEFSMQVIATDEELDPLYFDITNDDLVTDEIDIDGLTGEISFTPTEARTYAATVTVTDGDNVVSKQITITIN